MLLGLKKVAQLDKNRLRLDNYIQAEASHMRKLGQYAIGIIAFLIISNGQTAVVKEPIIPPSIGNYALPASQQPGPFLSFGQNIIDENVSQLYLQPNYLAGRNQDYWDVTATYLYGLSENAVVLFSVPIAVDYYEKPYHASGLADSSMQVEYAFYNRSNEFFMESATIVADMTIPLGSLDKNPATGLGAPGLFIGSTFNRMYTDWYWFVSPGVNWVLPNQNIAVSTEYFYQAGIGKNIKSKANHYIWFALLEIDGLYSTKGKFNGIRDPDSGGNIIYLTPSLMYSKEKFFIQAGLSFPLTQHWNGNQQNTTYNASFILGWTLN